MTLNKKDKKNILYFEYYKSLLFNRFKNVKISKSIYINNILKEMKTMTKKYLFILNGY